MLITITLLILGFIIGGFVIMLGGGGAAFYLGILTSISGISIASATATSLFTAIPALIIGAYSNYRTGNMQFKIGNQMLCSAVPFTIIGSIISHYISEGIYKWLICIIFVVLGCQVLYQSFSPRKAPRTVHPSLFKALFFGGVSGLMVGVAGLSGGSPLVAGMLLMGLEIPQAAATSSYALIITSFVGMIMHASSGNIAWGPGITLMIGAMVGSATVPYLIAKVNPARVTKILRPIMGVIMVVMGILTIF